MSYPIKLVRDRIAEHLGPGEATLTYERVETHGEHARMLRAKLVEEAVEYLTNPSLGELVDVLECLRGLAEIDLGVTWPEVVAARRDKLEQRGGFFGGVVMVGHHPSDDG